VGQVRPDLVLDGCGLAVASKKEIEIEGVAHGISPQLELVGITITVALAVPIPVEAVGVADSMGVKVIVGQVRPLDVLEAREDREA